MSVRNVVRVMNFHSLVRVDNAKKKAAKFRRMQEELSVMMSYIANNRNFRLDKAIIAPPEEGRTLHIYLGSDYGFCGNYNSKVVERIRNENTAQKILIGKKIMAQGDDVLLSIERRHLDENFHGMERLLALAITSREFRDIYLTYNHYENTSTIYLRKIQLYPIKPLTNDPCTDDFAVEGDVSVLYREMLLTYISYELALAVINSSAAENVLRQNTTTESLKRIDELEEEQRRIMRRVQREKEFAKVIDSYVKKQMC